MTNQIVNGYELIQPFQNKNAGFCKWTFALKDDKQFFIKQFMDPIYPQDPNLSNQIRNYKIKDCELFEEQKKQICGTVNLVSDGNLVRIQELFREGSHYYLAMHAVTTGVVNINDLMNYSFEDRVFLCRSIAHSINRLHTARFVHSDIKPSNVIIKKTAKQKLVGKIIDFDSGFFEYAPPASANELEGDLTFLSPEACLFMNDMDAKLSCKLDIFSLGILFHMYLTGSLPEFDHEKYETIFETVLEKDKIIISDKLPRSLADMICKMLICDPKKRIDCQKVYRILNAYLTGYNQDDSTKAVSPKYAKPDKNGNYFSHPGDLI